MDYLKSVMSRRRCSDPLPQLVSLSPLSDSDNTSTQFITVPDITETPKQKLNSGLSTWSKKVGQKWSKLKRNNSSELLTATPGRRRHWSPTRIETIKSNKKVSRAASIRNISTDTEHNYNYCNNSSTESISYDYKKLYQIYKDTLEKRTDEKITRGRRKIKSLNGSLRLSEKQFLDYLLLIKPNSQEDIKSIISDLLDQDVKCTRTQMESLSESKSCNPKQTRKFSVVRNIFSKLSSKSDDEDDIYIKKKSISSNSLPSLSEFLNSSKKAISLTEISNLLTSKSKNTIKCDESGYGSDSTRMDSPRESIKSQVSGGLRNDSSAINFPSRTEEFMELSFTFPSNSSCDGNLSIKEETYANTLRKECRSKFRFLEYSKRRRSESSETAESRSKRLNQNISPRKSKIDISDMDELCRTLNEKLKPKNENVTIAYPSTTLQTNNNYSTLRSNIDYEYKCVRLRLETTDFIGIKIGTKSDTERYIITDIVPESIAERNGNLKIGDEIIKVNGTRLRGVPFTFATSLLVPERNELEIIISREVICKTDNSPKTNQEKPTYNPFLSSATRKTMEEKNDKMRMNINPIYEQPNTPPYYSSGQDSKYSTLENKKSKSNTNSVQGIPLTGMRKFSYTQDHLGPHIYQNSYTTVSDSSSVHVVNFKKGPGMKSLGFSIVGGRDTPKRPMDLYVKTIFEEGQAAENGVLKEGDKLVSINGKSFEGLTHKEAIILFKSIKFGEIVLKIERLNHKIC